MSIGSSVASGALQGGGLGATFGPLGAGIGAIGGGIAGLIGGIVNKKKIKEEEKRRLTQLDKANQNLVLNQSRQLSTSYPITGFEGNTSFELGGKIDNINITNGGNAKKIAEDMFLFIGNSHNQGGIGLDSNADSIQDAEVENDEVFQEPNRIYSDSIKPDDSIQKAISSQLGISVNGTYAEISKKIAKYKDKFEDVTKGKDGVEMIEERSNQALDLLFQDQQLKNDNNGSNEFKMGGKMKKNNYALGGLFEKIGSSLSGVDNLGGQALNLGTYIANRSRLNNVQTNQTPVLTPNPVYNYKDNSSLAKTGIDTDTRSGVISINRSSSQNNARSIAKLMAEKFKAKSNVDVQSGVAENNAINQFRQELGQTQRANASIINATEADNIDRRNAVEAAKVDANNALIQGVVGNIQTGKMNDMQAAEILLTAVKQGDRGTVERLLQQFPELADTLGLNINNFLNTENFSNIQSIGNASPKFAPVTIPNKLS